MTNNNPAKQSIQLAHGSGGKASHELIETLFGKVFANPILDQREDQATMLLKEFSDQGDRIAMTTDSYVITPLFFPGGDIGKLAVCGTVNDLCVGGAIPKYLSCGFILEEGFSMAELEKITASMQTTAKLAGVEIVTGDTKVVTKGAVDKVFINTTGIGAIPAARNLSSTLSRPGDKIICNGFIGDHGAAVMAAREDLGLTSELKSDCAPLNDLSELMLNACPDIRCMRDATRGGVATVINELAQASGYAMQLDESLLPVRDSVRGLCEILGLEPLYLANEGKLIAIVPAESAEELVVAMQEHPLGIDTKIIGEVLSNDNGRVSIRSTFGGNRLLDMLPGEQLPRIC